MADLPRAVQAQVEAAEAVLAQANTAPDSGVGGVPADLAQLAQTPTEPPQVETPTTQETAPTAAPAQQPDVWEARYKSLQGLFNKEVPVLQHQVKELTARLQEMEQAKKVEQTQPKEQKPTVDPKDVEAFGSDLVEMVQRVANQILGGVAAKVDGTLSGVVQRIAALEQVVQGTTQTVAYTAEQTFFAQLSKAVPDWEEVNADQRFLSWLGAVDPVLGASRQAALDAAQKALDARRVAAIFNAFKDTLPKQAPTQKTATNVEKQISPSTVAAAAPQGKPEKPVLTQKQIADFYRDVGLGRYNGRQAEHDRIEKLINEAIADGRVT